MTVLECPSCNAILEVKPPDNFHNAVSSKPIHKSFHGNIIQKKIRCKNKDCRKTMTVYWYAPIEYFTRI